MKRLTILSLLFLLAMACFAQNHSFGVFLDAGVGYTSDENIGLGFVNSAKGFYFGVGAGMAIPFNDGGINFTGGVNIDFLGKPTMEFIRGQEHYDVENLSDQVSLRVMPYIEISKHVIHNLYLGFGVGLGFTNLYFGMPPQLYDINTTSYNSYKMKNKSITPVGFVRYYLGSFYFTVNYECDIVINGNITKLNGDPFAGDIDGADDIEGIHHRVRFAVGYALGF
ncbi:MAG: hypothetical protein LBC60_02325 [Spirochaetaceae bacterium]|jgi:hypothetical protein|nr:hypothetical protein [Spirochaetaceae bacterium]